MYAKHFFKMLIGLICMGLLGIIGLVFSSHYAKDQKKASAIGGGTVIQSVK